MAELLNVENRELLGKRNVRRLRRSGRLPAVIYGHGETPVSLTLSSEEINRAIRHGGKLYELRGGVTESAIIRSLQWDALGNEVLHVDFMRVKADERITVEVEIKTRGEAPGSKAGGVVSIIVHRLEIETLASAIPDVLHVNINHLELGGAVLAKDIEDLPAGAKLLIEPDAVIVQCVEPAEEMEEEAGAGAAEPEVIGRKAESEEDEE
jgi:large subunit ribosomal protein L25